MKRSIVICTAVLAIIAVAAACVISFKKLNSDDLSNIEKAVSFYADAVENTRNENDFQMQAVTNVKLKNITSSSFLVAEVISSRLGYEVGDTESNTQEYTFLNGSSQNTALTPFDVIQPAGAYIKKENLGGLTLDSVDKGEDHTLISFTVSQENADYESVAEELKKASPDLSRFAPKHSNFIDITDLVYLISDMIWMNALSEDPSSGVKFKLYEAEEIDVLLGDTKITADVNENGLLTEVTVTAPVVFDGTARVINSSVSMNIELEVSLKYTFGYAE